MTHVACPECGADSLATNRYCESCGLVLPHKTTRAAVEAAPAAEPPRRLRQREDRRQVGRAQVALTGIRALYGVLAFLSTALALVAWAGYMDTPERTLEMFLVVGILSTEACLNIAGFAFFRANPFVWTVVLASLQTLSLALVALTTDAWHAFAVVHVGMRTALAAALWCAVPITARVTRIWEQQEAEQARSGKSGRLATRFEAREMREQRQALRKFAVAAGFVVAMVFVAAWLPYRASVTARAAAEQAAEAERQQEAHASVQHELRAGQLDGVVREFLARWDAADLDGVKAHFTADKQASFWPKVEKLLEERDWKTALPKLGEPQTTDHRDGAIDVFFRIDRREQLKTRWIWSDGRWRIDRFMFSTR